MKQLTCTQVWLNFLFSKPLYTVFNLIFETPRYPAIWNTTLVPSRNQGLLMLLLILEPIANVSKIS